MYSIHMCTKYLSLPNIPLRRPRFFWLYQRRLSASAAVAAAGEDFAHLRALGTHHMSSHALSACGGSGLEKEWQTDQPSKPALLVRNAPADMREMLMNCFSSSFRQLAEHGFAPPCHNSWRDVHLLFTDNVLCCAVSNLQLGSDRLRRLRQMIRRRIPQAAFSMVGKGLGEEVQRRGKEGGQAQCRERMRTRNNRKLSIRNQSRKCSLTAQKSKQTE